jgi:hypothetical protein
MVVVEKVLKLEVILERLVEGQLASLDAVDAKNKFLG